MSSLPRISLALRAFKKRVDDLMFEDDETINLLLEISNYLLKEPSGRDEQSLARDYVSLAEFEEKYIFIARNTLSRYCKDDEEFRRECAILHNGHWLVHEKKSLEFFKRKPFFQNRLKRNFFQEKLAQ